jgi:hypothetical protein
MFSFKMNPVSIPYLLKFAVEWVDWVQNTPTALVRNAYFNIKGIHKATVDRWMVRCPQVKEASEFVKQLLSERREMGVLKGKMPEGWVSKYQALYDPEFKELEQWRNSMKEKIAGSTATIQVVELERYPDSPLVPVKKEVHD